MDPLDALAWPLRTPRLTIRRVTPADADATWAYRRLPEVGEWIGWFAATPQEYRAEFTAPGRLATVLAVELGGTEPRVIGDVICRVEDAEAQREVAADAAGRQAEVGWSLDPAHGGHGYATEAVAAVIDACFSALGVRRVRAVCFADNEPSWRLMERLGMRREAHTRASALHRRGVWLDSFEYAVLADEWRVEASERPPRMLV
ncbi:GNAT family N-acetyltransferase [Propioniciclava coleopterorum]|uniref:GNAT family N-acetyltransferase n=1 Tax=Propioniciclava coleopterorum TaxID=2714937 RepID=A0A6G7Y8A6_9ACTN|nr:GNAT family protein [Propioniciclava coleopterorum]QIK73124.1 GNAT family N-acetyltransferase [Propioniciclava coleopterorum]